MVRGGPVGVAVKRRLRERGFGAGAAFDERPHRADSGHWQSDGLLRQTAGNRRWIWTSKHVLATMQDRTRLPWSALAWTGFA